MPDLRRLVIGLSVLAPSAWAADAAPAVPFIASRVEALACFGQKDALQARRAAILANTKMLNARVDKYRAASKALRAEEDALDTTRQADVDSLSQRMDALNALLDAHDVDVEAADRAQQSLEEAAAAHNRRCAGMMLDQFVMEAVTRERANPNPSSAEARAVEACNTMSSATLANDMDRAVALVYPPAVQRTGKATIAAALRRQFVGQPQPGYRVVRLECAMPVQVSEAGGLQLALLPVFLTADTSKGLFKHHAFYLGISADNGQAWTFLTSMTRAPIRLR